VRPRCTNISKSGGGPNRNGAECDMVIVGPIIDSEQCSERDLTSIKRLHASAQHISLGLPDIIQFEAFAKNRS
jgi:hypothetical protein